MIIDISQEVFSCRVFDGDIKPERHIDRSMENGGEYNLTSFSMCAHNGTHADAPYHFINDGKKIDELGLVPFVGDCYVARHDGKLVSADVITIMENARDEGASQRILIGGNAEFTPEAARAFAHANIRLIGCEAQSIGDSEVHRIILGAGIAVLEGIVLGDVLEGKYFLSAAPLALGGAEGAPCRAYLMR